MSTEPPINKPELEAAFDRMREAIFAACTALMRDYEQDPRGGAVQDQRDAHLHFIFDEILDGRPLNSFAPVQLDLLKSMIAYWRECEVEVGAPEPDEPEPEKLQ